MTIAQSRSQRAERGRLTAYCPRGCLEVCSGSLFYGVGRLDHLHMVNTSIYNWSDADVREDRAGCIRLKLTIRTIQKRFRRVVRKAE